jgi:hypothetical protein
MLFIELLPWTFMQEISTLMNATFGLTISALLVSHVLVGITVLV